MNKTKLGITSANGYETFSYRERFALFTKCGFETILLWWGEGEQESRKERVQLADDYGLQIENVHADFKNCNSMWLSGEEGETRTNRFLKSIEDCNSCGIDCMVMHLTNGFESPPVSNLGLKRVEKIIQLAGQAGVRLALENVQSDEITRYILDHCREEHIGFCFDTGHSNIWCKEIDWLSQYKDRLMAIHVHDNNGVKDEHLPPFEGTLDWVEIVERLADTKYQGSLTLEAQCRGGQPEDVPEFLQRCYQAGKKLQLMLP